MKSLVKLIALLAASGCVATSPVAPTGQNTRYTLSTAELAVVQRSVASETMIPARARVSGVVASITPTGVVQACGLVSVIEPTGFYGPPRAFMGVLGENMAGTNVFVSVAGIAQTSIRQLATQQLCAKEGMAIGSAETKVSNQNVREMLAQERELNSRCRGTEGANPASTVCSERDAVGRKLNSAGWCYGRESEFGYQNEWHVCQADSIRLKD